MLKRIFAAVAIAASTAATAETPLDVPAKAGWKHARTGIILRASLAGFQRTALKDLSTSELDVSAAYSSSEDTFATIFIFRPALASLPIWFDRSDTAVLMGDSWKGASPFTPPMSFVPPGASGPSGLRRIYVPGRQSFAKSTAVAVMPYKDWLVAVRMTSKSLDPSALSPRLVEFVNAIELPPASGAAVAQPIAPCADVPGYDKRAKMLEPDMASALVAATLTMTANKNKPAVTSKVPVTWCKQTATQDYGVYRANNSKDSYTLALGDAGIVAAVSPALVLDAKPAYGLTLSELDRTLIYPNFNRLPAPQKAYEALTKSEPVSSVARDDSVTVTQ